MPAVSVGSASSGSAASISRLTRLCRRTPSARSSAAPVPVPQGGGEQSGSSGSDWMSYCASTSSIGESLLMTDLMMLAGSASGSRTSSISPEPASLRLVEPSSSGLAYLERGSNCTTTREKKTCAIKCVVSSFLLPTFFFSL